jgi:Flp pilus assembly protein TadG
MKRSLSRCERGTSLIEFAFTAPIFVLLLVGLIDVGRYTYYAILATHAARSGVQYAAQNLTTAEDASTNGPNTTGAALADAQKISNFHAIASVVCTAGGANSPCPANNTNTEPPSNLTYFVRVQVTGTFSPLISYAGFGSIPITATSVMRVINQ